MKVMILERAAWTLFMCVLLRVSGLGFSPVELVVWVLWGAVFVVGWVHLGRCSRAPGTAA